MIPWQADCTMEVPKAGLEYWNIWCQKSVGEAIIHRSGRQNAVDMISLSLPIPRDSLEVSLGAISPTSPSNATVELLASLLNNNTNAKCLFISGGDGVARSHH